MKCTLHPGAEHDVAEVLDFYEKNAGPAVSHRFLREFEHVLEILVEFPELGTPTAAGRRFFP